MKKLGFWIGLVWAGCCAAGFAQEDGIQNAPPEVREESATPKKLPRELKAEPVATPTPLAAEEAVASPTPMLEKRTPDEMVKAFFTEIEADKVDAAYEGLTAGTVVASRAEESKQLRMQTQTALDAYGPTHGYALISKERVGDFLERWTFLLRGELLPLRWKFYFYDAIGDGSWKLVDLRVDDDLVTTMDENGVEIGAPDVGESGDRVIKRRSIQEP